MSLKGLDEFYIFPPKLLPAVPQWSNFVEVFKQLSLLRYLGNSLFVSTTTTVLQLVLASSAAFAFAVLTFRGKAFLFALFISSMMVPGSVVLIPLFMITQKLGMIDSYLGLILPMLFSGYGVFMIRQFFLGLPRDFYEAARLDGCSNLGVFVRIYLPLSVPALATLGTLAFISFYNSLLWPLIVINSEELKTIPIGIAGLVGQYGFITPHLVMAGAAIMVVPALLVFLFFQRFLINGFVMSGVKG
ncbi:carbohydrate ABC transporter permease [Paenibacillus eucommiae]|uniref:ABC-type glycerol-3-phosphate transport system permease component n=1 Tax=Paenibacillus eucommiae TaxID=1355755 RepID=A0ABS4IWU9_9BACL|nr:carbohydrate ABC transporter permease [Paenibacillus eucommiae]MBP1992076.1 ABC-type glycerol-3-phosphate transport system permease component [Paenibacillus eucommiae]